MRNPAKSLEQVPGWWPIGARVSRALQGVVRLHPEYIENVLGRIGRDDVQGPDAATLQDARKAMA